MTSRQRFARNCQNGTLPTDPVQYVAIELLDTQVFSGSVQWVLLEISWIKLFGFLNETQDRTSFKLETTG